MNDMGRARSLIGDAFCLFVAHRGMTSPMDNCKNLLKEMKNKFGVGGTLADGVLEIQGSFAVEAVEILKKNGCDKAWKIGKQICNSWVDPIIKLQLLLAWATEHPLPAPRRGWMPATQHFEEIVEMLRVLLVKVQ
jgi:hypothetical protein